MFFSKKVTAVAAATLLASTASAQLSGLNLSGSCQASAIGLLFGDLGNCLAITNGLLPLFTASGSIVGPLDNYLNNNICNSAACSTGTLSSANQTLTDSCAQDLQSGSTLIVGLQKIIQEYPTVREIGCLQAAGNGSRCITQTLYAVQNATGSTIDVSFLTGLLGGGSTSVADLANLDASVLCTGCTKAIYQVATQANGTSAADSALSRGINQKCGSDFTSTSNSTLPADVSNTIGSASASATGPSGTGTGASASSTSPSSGAVGSWNINGLTAMAAGALGLGMVGGAFGVLA